MATGLEAAFPLVGSTQNLVTGADNWLAQNGSFSYVAGSEGQQLNLVGATTFFDAWDPWVATLGAPGTASAGMCLAVWLDITSLGFNFQINGDSGGTNPVNHLVFCSQELMYFAPGSAIHGWTGVEIPQTTGPSLFVLNVNGLDVDFYFNGALQGSMTLSGGTGSVGDMFRLTGYNGVTNGGADTDIISVRAWSRPLTGTELTSLHADYWALVTAGGGGPTIVNGTGTSSVTFGGTATGRVRVRGAGTSSVTLGQSAAGRVRVRGAGSAGAALGQSATGRVRVRGSGTSAAVLGQSAAARLRARASGSSSIVLGQSATGRVRVRGSGTSAVAFAGSAAARIRVRGTGTSTATFGGTISSPSTVRGTGTSTATFGGSAQGRVRVRGAGTSAAVFGGLATGRTRRVVSGTSAATFGGFAAGRVRVRGLGSSGLSTGESAVARLRVRGSGTSAAIFVGLITWTDPSLARKAVRLLAVGGRARLVAVGGRTRLEIP